LAVLFIVGKSVRLANILATDTKKGARLAEIAFEALTMEKKIDEPILKDKICGVVGDGAFMRKNKPFKKRLQELLDKYNLTFRWDLLHLGNRAHIAARGPTKYETKKKLKKLTDDGEDDSSEDGTQVTELGELINYIQGHSKTFRSGIKFTGMQMSLDFKFLRPKVWSSTRMCLFEWDMTMRFLQNKLYFEIPRDKVILCQMYCVVMYGLKIILKVCQKTDVTSEWVQSVMVGDMGEKTMQYCLKVSHSLLLDNELPFEDDQPDILNLNKPEPVDFSNNIFMKDLHKYVKGNKKLFSLEEDPSVRTTRGTAGVPVEDTITKMHDIVEDYITSFWLEMRARYDLTDLGAGPTSFSEAPAESVFSVWERVSTGRPSLKLENVVALVRVGMEGPPASSKGSLHLSTKALNRWPGKHGERFTTSNWRPGVVSKTISKIQGQSS